jgi:hypothetical protein
MNRYESVKAKLVARAGGVVRTAVEAAMSEETASEQVSRVRRDYHGLPNDALADVLTKRCARRTKWEGALNGAGVTALEVAIADPIPEPAHKAVAIAGTRLSECATISRPKRTIELSHCPATADA